MSWQTFTLRFEALPCPGSYSFASWPACVFRVRLPASSCMRLDLSGPLHSETKNPAMRNEGLRYETQRNLRETCVRNKATQAMCMIACGHRSSLHRGHAVGEQAARESAIRKGLMRDRPAKLAMRNQKPAKLWTACGGSCET